MAPASRRAAATCGGVPVVVLVRRRDHRDRGAGLAERVRDLRRVRAARAVDGDDAAGAQQVLGERHARGVLGELADGREEDRGALLGGVGAVAQRLEHLGVATPRQAALAVGVGARGAARELLVEVRVLADAGDRVLAAGDAPGALLPGLVEAGGEAPVVEHGLDPAVALDARELLPRRVGERVGERLDVPGAAGRVDHVREVRLLEQQRLGVAREASGGLVGTAQLAVEGQHRDGRGAAESRADGGDGACAACSPRGRGG